MNWEKFQQDLATIALIGGAGTISCLPIYYGGLYLYKGHQSEAWLPTTAIVEQSDSITTPSGDSKTHTSYRFRYRYWVNGRAYTSQRNSYKAGGGDVAWIVGRLKAEDAVKVYYNPINPAEVVVEKGYSWLQVLWILSGLGGLGFCVLGFLGLWANSPIQDCPQQEDLDQISG